MKRYSIRALLFTAALGLTYALTFALPGASATAAKSACGCASCQCPDCNGEVCSCDVCGCGTCGCQ